MKVPKPADPEYRTDPVTGRAVIIAPERASRPVRLDFAPVQSNSADECPFCEGREHQTPPELSAVRRSGHPNGPGWLVRVVPNRYPAVRPTLPSGEPLGCSAGVPVSRPGLGHHELVLESPDHRLTFTSCSDEQVGLVLETYAERLRALRTQPGASYVMLFKNAGEGSGASQAHVHSQILATDCIPPLIAEELAASAQYRDRSNRCVFCDLVARELAEAVRVIGTSDRFVALCPFASRFPLEAWVLPREHQSRFEEQKADRLAELAFFLRRLLLRLEALLDRSAYNYILHTAPSADADHYHWHLEITPRLVGLAGFEIGGGMHINPVPPEWAAQCWRECRA